MLPVRLNAPRGYESPALAVLMAVLMMAFFAQVALAHAREADLVASAALIPGLLTAGKGSFVDQGYRLITAAFLHGGIVHFLSNVWVLWLFGRSVETALGSVRFGLLFLLTAALGNLVHLAVYPDSGIPALGASGAVAGLFGAFIRLYPLSKVLVVVPIIILPVWFWLRAGWFILFWFGLQVLQGVLALEDPLVGGGIAWWIHIGGFLAGLALGKVLAQRTLPMPPDPPNPAPPSSQTGSWVKPDIKGPWSRKSRRWGRRS